MNIERTKGIQSFYLTSRCLMIQSRKENIQQSLISFFTTRVVYHSMFWIFALILFVILDDTSQNGFWAVLGTEFINVTIYAIIVYFNLFYLIPNYLSQKKFVTYIGLLILACLIITPLKTIVFYFKLFNLPERDALIYDMPGYFIFTVIVTSASTVFKIITDWLRHQQERLELQTQTMQSELRFLKSQINPHFLFNTLNNLYALTLKKSDKAPEIVIKLSEMMRYMLYECNEKQVTLEKEINYIRNYLDLETLRQGKNVEINFSTEGNVRNQKIAPLMFIPFLENSFKHGLNNLISKGFVNMNLQVEDQSIHFVIENSKAEALPAQTHKRSGGIGLVNVRRRLNILYPKAHELVINDNPKTYSVELKIDLDKQVLSVDGQQFT